MALQFGIKLWSVNQDLLEEAISLIKSGKFAYLEFMKVPQTDVQPFLKANIPFIIHAFEVDITNPACKEKSTEIIQESLTLATQLKAHWIIMHPWRGELEKVANFIDELHDSRIIIENMPYIGHDSLPLIGVTPTEIQNLCSKSQCGFCLDMNHAVKAACALGIPYQQHIAEFMQLNPTMYHLSDGTIDGGEDVHLAIGDGEYDMEFMMRTIFQHSPHACVTLEVPKEHGDLYEAKEGRERLISYIC